MLSTLAITALSTACLERPVVESSPNTSNLYVDKVSQSAVDKIDLLFMIDNSASMTDKQDILTDAVPVLLNRLVSPICVDRAGLPTGVNVGSDGRCPAGKGEPEFNPIGDIHIGVVSSSLGAHGGDQCAAPTPTLLHPDDRAHLIGGLRPDKFPSTSSWNNSGFLAWDASGKANTPPGTGDPAALNKTFKDLIVAVGESGCGYEASLESWYRFLIDPEPPASVTRGVRFTERSSKLLQNPDGSHTCLNCDDALLAQRRAFLRPDSLLAIVMLSDENDCSIRDDGYGWIVGANSRAPRSTAACDVNPNDACCRTCALIEDSPPPGCAKLADDPVCKNAPAKSWAMWDDAHDSPRLRCHDQRRRFGFDLLYETSRYVHALKDKTLPLQSAPGVSVTNPLYDPGNSGKPAREPSLVFLAGIVGVPWQDIADDASLTGPGLRYLSAKELALRERWQVMLGNPNPGSGKAPTLPSDPFMIETTEPRSGTNPIVHVSTSSADSKNPHDNVINGHEQHISKLDDLQFACTFPLTKVKDCAGSGSSCDCAPGLNGDTSALVTTNSPLCQGGATINTQTSAKAYPGLRELTVLRDFGENAIVASICPKVTTAADPANPQADPNYGYNPAVGAIIDRLKVQLRGKCLPRAIEADEQGQVRCLVVEAQQTGCDCKLGGRSAADGKVAAAVQAQLKTNGSCGNADQKPCSDWCMCEIDQVDNSQLKACQSNASNVSPGFCYVDERAEIGADANAIQAIDDQLSRCAPNERQLLRFVDADATHKTPAQGSIAFVACVGAAIVSAAR